MGTDQTALQGPPILRLTGISKQFPGVRALEGIDFHLFAGEVHALMGENGAGKSTLINIISGLLQPTSGQILVGGQDVVFSNALQAQKAGISTITQEFNLVPQLTVAENIFLGREPKRRFGLLNWPEIRRRASEVLEELRLNVPLNQRVGYLSVGDRQLVEIAKALSMDFRIITMDEPTAALNATEVARLFEIIERLKQRGIAVLYVSHRLSGGHGNLIGTVFAAILLATIASALNILKVISFYQYLAMGALLIFALAIDTARRAFIAKSQLSRS
jgi:galactofuranose transport system ATP-binding protein